jgi:Tol biopolymer transport system component
MTKAAYVVLTGLALCSTSCSESPSSPLTIPPAAFKVSGDGQVRFPDATLPINLTIQLVDVDGNDTQTGDVSVTWTVLDGEGTVGRQVDTTGLNGQARTSWTLGPNEGANRVRVEVGSFEPFVFTAHAVYPGPIAFVSNRRTGDMGDGIRYMAGDVFVMDENGSHVIQLSPHGRALEWLSQPSWSHNGTWLAYVRDPWGAVSAGDIYVIDSDGEEERRVGPSGRSFGGPSWSPDGQWLLVWSPTMSGLWIIGSGSDLNLFRLRWQSYTVLEPDSWAPDWSPDASTVVFECGAGDSRGICTIGVDSTGLRHLTDGPMDRDPAWSPDGTRILFARGSANAGGIWVMNADGSGQEQVKEGVASSPSWSPDGAEFVVAIANGSSQDIWRVVIATGEAINLTQGVGFNWDPTWRW